MLDIVAANDKEALARSHHQCLYDGKTFVAHRSGDTWHAEAPRQQAGTAYHCQHQQKSAEVTKKVDQFHDAINGDQP